MQHPSNAQQLNVFSKSKSLRQDMFPSQPTI
jgi:hypothetical protein